MKKTEPASRRTIDVHVGARILDRRRAIGMSRTELARTIGLSVQQLRKYESGMSTVMASRLFEIGRTLSVPIGYFFESAPGSRKGRTPPQDIPPSIHPPVHEMRRLIESFHRIANPELRRHFALLAAALAESAKAKTTKRRS